MAVQPKKDPQKFCEICGTEMFRKRFNGRLEDRTRFLGRKTCGQSCGNSRKMVQADSHRWRARQIHARILCSECGRTDNLHVHHKDRNPANNDPQNLVTLCASCHLKLHWREDREYRISTIRNATGESTRRRHADGKELLEGLPPIRLSSTVKANHASPLRSQST